MGVPLFQVQISVDVFAQNRGKSIVFAVWAAGMLALALQDGLELPQHTCFYLGMSRRTCFPTASYTWKLQFRMAFRRISVSQGASDLAACPIPFDPFLFES